MNESETQPPTWRELSQEQRVVLQEAFDAETLTDVLNAWSAPTEDAPYWNQKAKYVPQLISATQFLLRKKLVQLSVETYSLAGHRLHITESVLLDEVPALTIVTNPWNWWEYDPDLDEGISKEEATPRWEEQHRENTQTMYVLTATELAEKIAREHDEPIRW